MAKVKKEQLVDLLSETTRSIIADDSFEGSITYQAVNGDEFEVGAFVRVGNSMGQGGCMLIEATKDPNQPKILHASIKSMTEEKPTVNDKIYFVIFDGTMSICRWKDGWCDRFGAVFPPQVQEKFTYWGEINDFNIVE